jgi:hypothetical protein
VCDFCMDPEVPVEDFAAAQKSIDGHQKQN